MAAWTTTLCATLRLPVTGTADELARAWMVDPELIPLILAANPGPADERLLVLTATSAQAERLAIDLRAAQALLAPPPAGAPAPAGNIHLLPEAETDRQRLVPELESERARVLDLVHQGGGIFVASILAALAPTPAPRDFQERHLLLQRGATDWPPQRLAQWLTDLDYDNEPEVHVPGEFSWRGGILDVYSPVYDYPVRLDYFGDELESIRRFDPETQRSLGEQAACRLIPRGEALWRQAEATHCFLDFIAPYPLRLALCQPALVAKHLDQFGTPTQHDWWRRVAKLTCPRHVFITAEDAGEYPPDRVQQVPFFALSADFRGALPELSEGFDALRQKVLRGQLARWVGDGYQLVVSAASQGRREREAAILAAELEVPAACLHFVTSDLATGWYAPGAKVAFLTESELFGKAPARPPPRRRETGFHADHALHGSGGELAEGDYAVHAAYGICKFHGLRFETFQNQVQEVLVLEFADEVTVFVPVDQAYLVGRYVGAAKALPKLSKVGGHTWKQATKDATHAVHDLAAELIRLQAVRQSVPGFPFTGEPTAQAAFAEAFPYTETPDQLRAIDEVLADMAVARPMDRLLCGDVGFGKTEVAMRAAFQVVTAGKQVAVLVPTTILCQQHFFNFRERFKGHPIIIENLSSFRTSGEQKAVLEALTLGTVDIVIGTHRLLSGDVRFKDLGLVVVDEEQRFGVKHKERLKLLRTNVDVLTMTATPIPRTLYLSMAGLRDLSTIVSPPLERLPVQTIVAEHDDTLVRDALLREIERGGQVFYLHNRVKSIEKTRDKLQAMLPGVRFDIGHGQMHEHELEAVMLRFMEHQTDVLVSTTIIESGLDIPNANTIIIERADTFGLAELYQLRGRVGRYHRQAYAYLLIPRSGLLDSSARERLAAMRRYTQLGAGFKLALRDLEIRGAGNLLGAEQSGHITAIGFDLYCQLLREAVARMKNQPAPQRPTVALHLPFLAFGQTAQPGVLSAALPADYVHDETLRVELYRRLSLMPNVAAIDAFADELRDRFGEPPPTVQHLLAVARLKLLAHLLGIHSISLREGKLLLETPRGHLKLDGRNFPRLTKTEPAAALAEVTQLVVQLGRLQPGAPVVALPGRPAAAKGHAPAKGGR